MSNPYTAIDRDAIHVEPGCAFWTDGAGRVYLGLTEDGATLTVGQNVVTIKADEAGETPVKHVFGGTTARLEIKMLETSFARISRVFPSATYAGGVIKLGRTPGQAMPRGQIIHRPFEYPAGDRDLVVGNATSIGDLTLVHKHTEPIKLDLTFEGCIDENEADGNLLKGGIGYQEPSN